MRDIELHTRDGHFVALVEIPPFPAGKLPEVVTWGTRCFVMADESAEPPRYTEAFAVVSCTPSPSAT